MQKHSNENEFDLHENELVGGTHFHENGFALGLVLTRRQKGTRKWPIDKLPNNDIHCTITYYCVQLAAATDTEIKCIL